MAGWRDRLRGDPTDWLLERDEAQPAVRYFALRDLLGLAGGDPDVVAARAAVMASGPVPIILAAQQPEGYWVKPGPGYGPKYQGTVWQVVFLSQLGADGSNARVRAACEYVLSHNIASNGAFSVNATPSSFIHCVAGNLGAALIDLGWWGDERLERAIDWQARLVTGAGIAAVGNKQAAERYYAYTPGPLFRCGPNGGLPCAWGAVKAMLALSKVPIPERTPVIDKAIRQGVDFLLSHDPAVADYPFGYGARPNSSWFKFGYPIGYVTDVLQNLEVLAALGHGQDARLAAALDMVEGKQDAQGRWKLEYGYNGKTWVNVEQKGKPSKWVTLRALRVLKAAYPQ
jgi:hypothetical protein